MGRLTINLMKKAAKQITLFLYCSFAFNSVTAQGIIFFEGTWEAVLIEAESQNKPIFLDAYASWCGPCKYMDAMVFPKQKLGEYYNRHFINYKLDMEKGEGPQIAKIYKVGSYPTFLYIESNGRLIHRAIGAKSVEKMLLEARKVKSTTGD